MSKPVLTEENLGESGVREQKEERLQEDSEDEVYFKVRLNKNRY